MPSTIPPAPSGTHAFTQPRKLQAREFLKAVFGLKLSLSSTHGGLGYATWLRRMWNSFQTSCLCPLEQGSDFSGTDLHSAGQHTVATNESHSFSMVCKGQLIVHEPASAASPLSLGIPHLFPLKDFRGALKGTAAYVESEACLSVEVWNKPSLSIKIER